METLHLESIVSAIMLIGIRVSGFILFTPFFSGEGIPAQIKIALTAGLTALLYPICRNSSRLLGALQTAEGVCGEFVVGMLMGLAVQLVFEGAQMAGQILGVQAGYSLVTTLDPQTQADTPVLSTFNQLITMLIYLQFNIHHWVLRSLSASFTYLPAGTEMSVMKSGVGLFQAAGGIWLAGLQLAAPVLAATLLVDITLGFLSKASPQMPVLFVGLSFKTVVSLVLFAGSLVRWPGIFEQRFLTSVALGERLLHLSR